MICNIPFVYRIPELARLRELALAATLAARHYPVRIWTNLPLERIARWPAEIMSVPRGTENLRPWSCAKLVTYLHARPDKDRLLFIDSDVFLSKPLPEAFLYSPLFAQSEEGVECYSGLAMMPKTWRDRCAPDLFQFRGYNMGVFGGDSDLVSDFAEHALDARRFCDRIDPPSNLIEQAPLQEFARSRGVWVATLFKKPEEATELGYTHLMADKNRWDVRERVAERLWEEDPYLADQLSIAPLRPKTARVNMGDVEEFWRNKRPLPKEPAEVLNWRSTTLTNTPSGLGDTVVLSGILPQVQHPGAHASIWSQSRHFQDLIPFMPRYLGDFRHLRWASLSSASELYDLGAGHNIQRACRLLGLPVPRIPKGHLVVPGKKKANRVTIHLNPGGHARWQRENIHPRARTLDDRTFDALVRFIESRTDLEFVQIGESLYPGLPDRVRPFVGKSMAETLMMQQKATYHLGILSGPMHTAAALDCRCIVLTVMPKPSELMLPTMVDTGIVEGEWIPPQAVVLHQEIDSPHWPLVTVQNLNRAIDGDVWPYWNNDLIEWQP